jgi:membrane-bound lytic murein transglycosylase D
MGLSRKFFYGLPLLILLTWALAPTAAREVIPEDDGPEQQEEVMPVMPAETAPPTEAAAVLSPKWMPSDFSNQTRAIGWTPEVFKVPAGMEERVQFWKDIYTKYTSDQGLLHDSKYIKLIYERVDFNDITANPDMSDRQKEKARRKRVNDKKKEIAQRLKNLQKVSDPTTLTGDDKRYWDLFANIAEPKKFVEATSRKRLRFQLGQRNQFAAGIYQSGRYLRQMEEIFRQEGVPLELTRLPYVESSFNLRARSKVGASGLWQFMRTTARLYMRMDNTADERNDPLSATRAAARKLKDNYEMLKTWPLAITAYNRGPNGVRRLVEQQGTTNIVELLDVRKGRFGFASASYYASFLAALDVEQNAKQYFGEVEIMPELRGAEIQLVKSQSAKDLLKWFNNDISLAQMLNPHVTPTVWKGNAPLNRKHILRVPLLQESQARNALE